MKKLWLIVSAHLKQDFNAREYFFVLAFILVNLTFNYIFKFDRQYIRPLNSGWEIAARVLFYCWSYYPVIIILYFFKKDKALLSRRFLLLSGVGLIFHSINAGFPYLYSFLQNTLQDQRLTNWMYKTGSNLEAFVLSTLPLLIVAYFFIEKGKREHLGLTTKTDLTPYFKLLAIVIPCIALAAYEKGLGNYYPTYKPNVVAEVLHWPGWVPPFIYEFAYALDFLNVEFFFRGFLVIGLGRFIGSSSILAMASAYCFLHFSKPIGEAVSSIFGGYILGVISFHTRSIWGGFILHVGVALSMELAAYLLKNG